MKTIASCFGMNITGVKGLTFGTLAKPLPQGITIFKALGTMENEE